MLALYKQCLILDTSANVVIC